MKAALLLCRLLIRPGDVVFDVGGHIGYVAMYFGSLVGPEGRVFTFEADPGELPYLRQNAENARHRNIILVENAVGAEEGETGAAGRAADVVRLDQFAEATGTVPSFVRIDAPGAEHLVLRGMKDTLAGDRPRLMVGITGEFEGAWEELRRASYILLDETKRRVEGKETEPGPAAHLIALPAEDEEGLARLGTGA
jgi:hypothetical protein